MKRSDMLEKLENWFERMDHCQGLIKTNLGKSKALLDALEMWGMEPPRIFHLRKEDVNFNYWDFEDGE